MVGLLGFLAVVFGIVSMLVLAGAISDWYTEERSWWKIMLAGLILAALSTTFAITSYNLAVAACIEDGNPVAKCYAWPGTGTEDEDE